MAKQNRPNKTASVAMPPTQTPPETLISDESGEEVTIKVFPAERDLINKVAGARGQKVALLFRSKEVRQFLIHLMQIATKAETERLEGEDRR